MLGALLISCTKPTQHALAQTTNTLPILEQVNIQIRQQDHTTVKSPVQTQTQTANNKGTLEITREALGEDVGKSAQVDSALGENNVIITNRALRYGNFCGPGYVCVCV